MKLGRNLVVLIALSLVFAACKKKEEEAGGGGGSGGGGEAPQCPAAAVTVDGQAVPVAHTLAYYDKTASTWSVAFFNQPGATCEQILAPTRQVPEGEQSGIVSGGGDGPFASGVSFQANANMTAKTRLDAKTDKVGEPVTICVPEPAEWEGNVGDLKGKKISVVGAFTGSYCGER